VTFWDLEDGRSGRKPLLQTISSCRSGFSRDPCVFEGGEWRVRGEGPSYKQFHSCRSGFSRDPCVIEGGEFGAKAPPTKKSFCRSGFSRDCCGIEEPGLGFGDPPFGDDRCCHLGRPFGAKAPPTEKSNPVGAALAATHCDLQGGGFGIVGAASSLVFGILKAEGSGRKPLLRR